MIRIVKMTFKPEHCNDFIDHFNKIDSKITAMPGCERLKLHRDLDNPAVFFTYSFWKDDKALQHYRTSLLFIETWKTVKAWFSEPAAAWSVDTLFDSK